MMEEIKCPQCGAPLEAGAKTCKYCGETIPAVTARTTQSEKSKLVAGLLGIFLGGLGIHKFYLGYKKEGIIMLVVCLVGAIIAVGPAVAGIVGLIEGIIYLTKSDDEFHATYIQGHKGWF